MAIIRLYAGADGQSHFGGSCRSFESRGDKSETAS